MLLTDRSLGGGEHVQNRVVLARPHVQDHRPGPPPPQRQLDRPDHVGHVGEVAALAAVAVDLDGQPVAGGDLKVR